MTPTEILDTSHEQLGLAERAVAAAHCDPHARGSELAATAVELGALAGIVAAAAGITEAARAAFIASVLRGAEPYSQEEHRELYAMLTRCKSVVERMRRHIKACEQAGTRVDGAERLAFTRLRLRDLARGHGDPLFELRDALPTTLAGPPREVAFDVGSLEAIGARAAARGEALTSED